MNIANLLKYCPKGTKLYSTVFGEVIIDRIDMDVLLQYIRQTAHIHHSMKKVVT